MNGNTQKPEKNFRIGGVRAAVWKWTNKTRDGRTFEQRKVVLDRSYRDNSNEWKNTNSYTANDVPKAILALTKAYEYLCQKGNGDNGADAPDVPEEIVQ